tara:strand:+ start:217 stop:552 length:336 start_codon:yes stop_codon:yes gene_type:complete
MLETEIKNLTNAIKELTAVMSSATQEMKEDAKTIVEKSIELVEAPVEEVVEEVVEAPTHDTLRAAILAANRADNKNKAIIKGLLSDLGAKKVTDVKESEIPALLTTIQAAL